MIGQRDRNGASRAMATAATRIGVAGLALMAQAASAEWKLNLQTPVTESARHSFELHSTMLWIITLIFVGVFAVVTYSIIYHRKSKGVTPATFHDNTTVEILWTAIPFVILIGISVPATKALVSMRDTSQADLTVKVTGYQWKWGYEYLSGDAAGIKYMSVLSTPREQIENKADKGEHYLLEVDNPMVVPVGKKVRVLTTAADVIHNWSMPAFAIKVDAVPGFVRDGWFRAEKIGTYRGQCSELCGKDHGFMPVVVNVVSDEDYAKWVADKQKEMAAAAEDPSKVWTLGELQARGEKVYAANCAACHQPTGKGLPPAFPALDGSKIATGPKEGHVGIVLNGKAGTAMAAFGKQLSDTDIAAVVTYERNAWGNKVGDFVQPAEVKAMRQ